MPYANRFDVELQGVFETREKDWRNGAVVYQVIVDRFAPSANLDAKRALYPAPRVLRRWDEEGKQPAARTPTLAHDLGIAQRCVRTR